VPKRELPAWTEGAIRWDAVTMIDDELRLLVPGLHPGLVVVHASGRVEATAFAGAMSATSSRALLVTPEGELRETLDAGMLANFPGWLYLETNKTKQLTNHFRIPPGGGAPITPNGQMAIQDLVMPLPYKDVSPAFVQFLGAVRDIGQSVGNMAEVAVGEGKQDAPVGTTLALLEVATRVEGAVHKDLYTSQSEELQIIKELLREDPEALWRG
jgi:hypothetical protein